MNAERFRALACALEGAEERAHMGHPDFRVNGRIFATLLADGQRGTVKLTADEQASLMAEAPEAFAPAAGAWGRQGWTMIDLRSATADQIRGALVLAWEGTAARPARRATRARR